MAKVTGPLMSLDASGTVGKTAVFSKWKGQNYVRLRVTPMNRQTSDMQNVRIKCGGMGYACSFVTRDVPGEGNVGFYSDAKAAAPAGQSWISFAMKQLLGANMSTFDGKATAYTSVNPTNQGYYATAAANLGLTAFSIAVVGTVTSIVAAEILYHLAWFAHTDLDGAGSIFATDPDDASAAELANLLLYLGAELPS